VQPTLRPKTVRIYAHLARGHLIPALGSVRLTQLAPADVQGALNRARARGLSPQTVHHLRAVLRTALNHALKEELIVRNAAALASPPHVRRRDVTVFDEALAARFIAAVRGDRLEALFRVAL